MAAIGEKSAAVKRGFEFRDGMKRSLDGGGDSADHRFFLLAEKRERQMLGLGTPPRRRRQFRLDRRQAFVQRPEDIVREGRGDEEPHLDRRRFYPRFGRWNVGWLGRPALPTSQQPNVPTSATPDPPVPPGTPA